MSIGPVGPGFNQASSFSATGQRNQREHIQTRAMLLLAARMHQEFTRGVQRQQQQQAVPIATGTHTTPKPNALASTQRPQPGWSTENTHLAHELAHFGGSALAHLGIPPPQRLEQSDPTARESKHTQTSAAPSASDLTHGTTKPLSPSRRDEAVRGEAVGQTAGAQAHSRSRLNSPTKPTPAFGSAHKSKEDTTGDVTVTIPSARARQMGLLGPREKDRAITTSLPKSLAAQLGLAPVSSQKKVLTARAPGRDGGAANANAAAMLS